MNLIGRNGKLLFLMSFWGGENNAMSSEESKPPSHRQREKGSLSLWQSPQERTELRRAITGLSDEDPEIRRASAEQLARFASEEALLALRAANAVESIVGCKAEIVRAIRALEERIQPQPQPA
jgi:hypothetical protein